MKVSLIAAAAKNGVIGRGGDLPWRMPADMRLFRRLTTGHHIIMGRSTWTSIGRPLTDRTNVVLSRDPDLRIEGCVVVRSMAEALDLARAAGDDEAFVIGGAQVYAAALPYADRIYLTRIDAEIEGDTHLPPLDPKTWVQISREEHPADERHAHPYAFCILERRSAAAP